MTWKGKKENMKKFRNATEEDESFPMILSNQRYAL